MSNHHHEYTKAGKLRKRKPGAGRPKMGRTAQPPKIRSESMQQLRDFRKRFELKTVADALENVISIATS